MADGSLGPQGQHYSIPTLNISGEARVTIGSNFSQGVKRVSTLSETLKVIPKWLSPLRFNSDHDRIRTESQLEHQPGASTSQQYPGRWLLESETFQNWADPDCQGVEKLWYHGIAGAGKSVLASIIITHLVNYAKDFKQSKTSARVAYLYLSHRTCPPVEHLVGSVVEQLLCGLQMYDQQDVLELHKKRNGDPPTVVDLSDLLRSIARERKIFIVVDALDECRPQDRQPLMNALQPSSKNIRILVTSRTALYDFKDLADGFQLKEVSAQPEDIDLYIDHVFNSKHRLGEFSKQNPGLREEVKSAIKRKCGGMFLLASLPVRSLQSAPTIHELLQRLETLPKDIPNLYQAIWKRIDEKDLAMRTLAINTLSWVAFSYRPLTVEELRHALATDLGNYVFNDNKINVVRDIKDSCEGLITFTGDLVTPVHYTAKDFISETMAGERRRFHTIIARTCLTYLSLEILEQPDDVVNNVSYADDLYQYRNPDSRTTSEIQRDYRSGSSGRLTFVDKCEKFPFLIYAGLYLAKHLREPAPDDPSGSPETIKLLDILVRHRPKRNFLLRLLDENGCMDYLQSQDITSWTPKIPVVPGWPTLREIVEARANESEVLDAASIHEWDGFFRDDVDAFLRKILRQDDPSSDSDASSVGSKPVGPSVECDSNDEHRTGRRASSPDLETTTGLAVALASVVGHDQVPRCTTPFHLASFFGWIPFVESLASVPKIELRAHISTLDERGHSPLDIAVIEGYWDVVNILLDLDAPISLTFASGHAVLLHAASQDRWDIVDRLISQALGQSLVPRFHFKKIIQTGQAFINSIFHMFCFPWTTQGENGERVALLAGHVADDAPPDPPSCSRHYPQLLQAARFGDAEQIRNLVADGHIDFATSSSIFHITALFLAVESAEPDAVVALLQSGADVDMLALRGSTPLHRAAARNNIEVVSVLLSGPKKPNVTIRDDEGRTAWLCSIYSDHAREHKDILDVLLAAGANPEATNLEGVTPLYQAASCGDAKLVRILLGYGLNPSIQTAYGWTPLHWAAGGGHLECVQLLLDHNANPNLLSDTNRTPLDMANGSNQDIVRRLLVERGAKTYEGLRNTMERSGGSASSDNGHEGLKELQSSGWRESWEHYLEFLAKVARKAEGRADLTEKDVGRVLSFISRELDDVLSFSDEDGWEIGETVSRMKELVVDIESKLEQRKAPQEFIAT